METMTGYCFKCKAQRPLLDAQPEWAPNGTAATRGRCAECGGGIYKLGRTAAHADLPKPETPPAKREPAQTAAKPSAKSKTAKAAAKSTGAKPSAKSTTAKAAAKTAATKAPAKSGAAKSGAAKPGAAKSANGRSPSAPSGRRHGTLVIVESPAKAKTIGKYLGRGYTVRSSVGHVRDLLKSRLSVDPDNGYEPEYRVLNEKRKVVAELKEAAEHANTVLLATDPDREGEAIAWHVLEAAEVDPRRAQRVVFHEITQKAVQAAIAHPREIDMRLVHAQQARRVLDRLVGYKLSPLLWRKVKGRLSAGRVQSVAVRLVVEREREIEQFVSTEYWTVDAELTRQDGPRRRKPTVFRARWLRYRDADLDLKSEADVTPHLEQLEQAAWSVGQVKTGTRKRRPMPPFTTSTLQQEASRKLGLGTTRTMRLAQDLYEGIDAGAEGTVGLITYMRTDSVTVAREAQEAARDYVIGRFGAAYAPEQPPVYKTRSKTAQEAHEAIRPTAVTRTPAALKPYLNRDQLRLYELIWSRFLASQMEAAVYATVSADIWAGAAATPPVERPYLFRATGSTLTFPGFLALYEETRPTDRPDDGDNQVPADLADGELLQLIRLLPEQHFTQPPPRYSEASLVKELEENGIGRPSTYASIISTIQERGYVARENKRLAPTEIGRTVTAMLVDYFPTELSVDFTAHLEDELDEIAAGDKAWAPVVDQFYRPFRERLAVAEDELPKVSIKVEPDYVGRACPLCGSELVYRQGRFGRFIGCSTFPTCRHTEQIIVSAGVVCPVGGGELIEKRTRTGRTFYGCSRYPDCQWSSWKKPVAGPPGDTGILVEDGKDQTKRTECALQTAAAPTPQ